MLSPLLLSTLALEPEPFTCHHEILGVTPATLSAAADRRKLDKVFRRAAREAHPDRAGGSQSQFLELRASYDTLLDGNQRAHYLRTLDLPDHKRVCRDTRAAARRRRAKRSGPLKRVLHGMWDLSVTAMEAALRPSARLLLPPRDEGDATHTAIFLDNSASMLYSKVHASDSWDVFRRRRSSTYLQLGHTLFRRLAACLHQKPRAELRVGLFASTVSMLADGRERLDAERVLAKWDGGGGGTYLWHMIEKDLKARLDGGGGRRQRVFVITDGEDNMSPARYRGVRGMDPMMRALMKANIDVEFHVVVLGTALEGGAVTRYRSLAQATGGQFVHVGSQAEEGELDAFAARVCEYTSLSAAETARLREAERRKYELALQQGRASRFEWYQALAPPGSVES